MTRRKPQDFDTQAIPNYDAQGRIGELDPDEPEERESSVQSEDNGRTLRDDRARGVEHAHSESPEPASRRTGPRKGPSTA